MENGEWRMENGELMNSLFPYILNSQLSILNFYIA
jgi:hypothetical protein